MSKMCRSKAGTVKDSFGLGQVHLIARVACPAQQTLTKRLLEGVLIDR